MSLRAAMGLCVLLVGCGAAAPKELSPVPAKETTAALVGHRCKDQVCKCRAPGDAVESEPPAEGSKRFELKLGRGPGNLWVTVDGSQQLFASTQTAESCFYLDLSSPGKHEIIVRGQAEAAGRGVGGEVEIKEYGGQNWWYETAYVQCGFPGPCEPERLREWKTAVDGYERNLRDPCGSTKVRAAEWQTGTLPDGQYADDFVARFVLDVYPFAPKAGPGMCDKAQAE